MFSNKVAGIFILILIILFSGCTNSSVESIPEQTQVATQTLIKPAETPWWVDKPNYHYGVIVDEEFTHNFKVYNELQRESP